MPARLIREGIIASDRIEALRDFEAETFYRRLLNKVDDHGLYDGRVAILRASLYPLALDRVKEADIKRWLALCVVAGLVVVYQVDGKPYLHVRDTRWQVRSEPRYPLPPHAVVNNCEQVPASGHLDEDVVVDGDVDKDGDGDGKRARRAAPPPDPKPSPIDDIPQGVKPETWAAWKRVRGRKLTAEAIRLQTKHLAQWRAQGHDPDYIVERSIANGWAGLHPPDKPKNGSTGPPRTLAERRTSTVDSIVNGPGHDRSQRTIEGTAERLDSEAVPALPVDLREQG